MLKFCFSENDSSLSLNLLDWIKRNTKLMEDIL
jgi:hypothetical protein